MLLTFNHEAHSPMEEKAETDQSMHHEPVITKAKVFLEIMDSKAMSEKGDILFAQKPVEEFSFVRQADGRLLDY